MLEPKTSSAGIIEMQNVGIRYGQGPEILSDIKLSLKKALSIF